MLRLSKPSTGGCFTSSKSILGDKDSPWQFGKTNFSEVFWDITFNSTLCNITTLAASASWLRSRANWMSLVSSSSANLISCRRPIPRATNTKKNHGHGENGKKIHDKTWFNPVGMFFVWSLFSKKSVQYRMMVEKHFKKTLKTCNSKNSSTKYHKISTNKANPKQHTPTRLQKTHHPPPP